MNARPSFTYRVAQDGFDRFHVEVFATVDPMENFTRPGPLYVGRTPVHPGYWTTLHTTRFRKRAFRLVEKYRTAAARADVDAARALRVVVNP